MLRQHAAAKRFNFAESNGRHARALEAKRKAADARKQVQDAHHGYRSHGSSKCGPSRNFGQSPPHVIGTLHSTAARFTARPRAS